MMVNVRAPVDNAKGFQTVRVMRWPDGVGYARVRMYRGHQGRA